MLPPYTHVYVYTTELLYYKIFRFLTMAHHKTDCDK